MADDEKAVTEICYDAFVIYNPEALDQLHFVKEMADILEGQEHNLRLFIPWRDDLPTDFNHIIKADTLKKKCRRVIVVLSHSFENCPAADFQINFYLSLSQGARHECVIPLLIDQCPLPPFLDLLNTAIFYNEVLRDWQWSRVAANLKFEPAHPLAKRLCSHIDVNTIVLDTSNTTHRQWWKNSKSLTSLKIKDEPEEIQTTSQSFGDLNKVTSLKKDEPRAIQTTSQKSITVDSIGQNSSKLRRKIRFHRRRPVKKIFKGLLKKICSCWK